MVNRLHTSEEVLKMLREISDPEIPVVSIVEMKIVSRVEVTGDNVNIQITPTFAGCPAVDHIKEQIRMKLSEAGFLQVNVTIDYKTPWSTDALDKNTRNKLREFGIAPPALKEDTLTKTLAKPVPCPFCQSFNTTCESSFGATLCKQLYYCNSCKQSFDRFKPL